MSGRRRRTPTLLQMEAAECGAAALGIILGHHGCWVTLEELRLACNVSRDGSSALAILRAARAMGLEAQAERLEPADLRTRELPAIIHWGMNHFLVVEGFSGDRVRLNDPATGPREVGVAEFDRMFTGIVLFMQPGPGFRHRGSRPSLVRGLTRRLHGAGDAFGFILMVSLALVVPGLLVPVFAQIFIDQILVNRFATWLWPLILGMGLAAVLMAALTFLQREALLRLETRLALQGAAGFVGHVIRLPLLYFAQRHPGEVASRVMLNDRLAQLIAGDVGAVLLNLLTATAYLAAMMFYAPGLGLLVAAGAAVNLVLLTRSSRALADDNRRMVVAGTMQAGFARQGLGMIEAYKAAGLEDLFRARLSAMSARVLNLRQGLARRRMRLTALPGLTSLALGGLVLVIGADMVIRGELTLGMLIAFQALMAGFLAPMAQLVQLGARIQDGQAYIQVLDDTLRHPTAPEFAPTPDSPDTTSGRLIGAIELRDVSAGYGPAAAPLIGDLNLSLNPGERLGIVGASGSGKSTLAALIAGIHPPAAGEILIDGTAMTAIPRARLRQSLAYVDQRAAILEGSIRDNIALWDPSLPDERIVEAARMALIHDVILRRPGGYGGHLAEGGTDLSGGQRARIEIARALVREPRILILDEATAFLDNETETKLHAGLRRLGATMIIVAHRFSAIRDCDRVIVMDRGVIVQEGTPEALLSRPGPFLQLMAEG
ncbi:MAG: NHLP family bacteriocin export ABC transporter peptidase/permease/ATPase [Tistrella sp.]|uniref:NHLP family bacteriocin export ABC transporter peptidase/permease/ATPase n=1 Tax=Tistrella mobilis TaxID=171437 RepID=A0A3B9IIP4_9PROT|nr:cysteine peptidase family C39 domain-containing protein [Tistrella sp.]MAD36563.1 NHLP family bacteriocin export ABC transporter peptidase/permease/ATPase [Tistrella sp.]MBA75669.1 NHLP family bacteriocin export ABC transporter peptidase/permease/ATPase [Tistrella sp.]HAE47099.1 NHLP family bacteriocin export ABC transporter peptidase/permease/ATPase [Tistrella mobilis]